MIIWATGNYPAGSNPWSATPVSVAPAFNYLTPGLPVAAQAFNSILNTITSHALDKTGDAISGGIAVNSGGTITINVTGGLTTSISQGIFCNVAQGISAGSAGAITSNAIGGFRLLGGATDWITFPTRQITGIYWLQPMFGFITAGWSIVGNAAPPYFAGGALSNIQRFILPVQHNGATINAVTIKVSIVNTHTSLPTTYPSIRVRRAATNLLVTTVQDLSSTATQSLTASAGVPATVAAYNLYTGVSMTYSCNQNSTLDNTQAWLYWVEVNDEFGGGATAGNQYFDLEVLYFVTDVQV